MNLNWDLLDFISGLLVPAVVYLIKQKTDYIKASKNLGMNIDGRWFSAELDFKQKVLGNAYVEVGIRRKKLGNQVVIKTLQQLNKSEVKHETAWIVNGKVLTESTIVSDFIAITGHSAGYGNAFLRFIGNGRAVGYWVGYSSKYSGQPMYGYWILSRDENDLKEMAEFVLAKFQYFELERVHIFLVTNRI